MSKNRILPKDREFCKSLTDEQLDSYIQNNAGSALAKELGKNIKHKKKTILNLELKWQQLLDLKNKEIKMGQKNSAYDNLKTRGNTQDDIFLSINKSVTATVVMAANSKLSPGDALLSTDGGKTFTPAFLDEYDDTKADYAKDVKVVSGDIFLKL